MDGRRPVYKHLSMQRQLNRALSILSISCELWKLKINTSKTVYIIPTLSPEHTSTTLHQQLQVVAIQKDNKVSWCSSRSKTVNENPSSYQGPVGLIVLV